MNPVDKSTAKCYNKPDYITNSTPEVILMKYDPNRTFIVEFPTLTTNIAGWTATLISASHEPPRKPWAIALHSHNSFEIHFIANGHGNFVVDVKSHEVHRGNIIVTGPDILHAQTSGIEDSMEEYVINIFLTPPKRGTPGINDGTGKLMNGILTHPFIICGNTDVSDKCLELLHEATEQKVGWRENISALLVSLLITTGREIQSALGSRLPRVVWQSNEKPRLVNRRRIIDTYLRGFLGDIDEDTLASMLFVSRRQLSRIMKEYCQATFTEKVNDLRLGYAKQLILTTNLQTTEISQMCGFSSVQYFYRVFRKKYGTTPTKLRLGE